MTIRTSHSRALAVLTAFAAAAMVSVLVAYGSASARTNDEPNRHLNANSSGAPTVKTTKPADNATNVDPAANITATFSEKMLKSSISGDTVKLYEGLFTAAELNSTCDPALCGTPPSPVASSVSYALKKQGKKRVPTAVLNPTATLRAGTTYTLLIEGAGDTDGFAVKDLTGNEMAQDKVVHFRTKADCNAGCTPA